MSSNRDKNLQSSQNVKVVVRVRPPNGEEINNKRFRTVLQCLSDKEIQNKEKKYQFDRVFHPESTQLDIYTAVVAPMIKDVMAGYNCTIFAYGQTGSGKTHTMIGGNPGMTPNLNWKEDPAAGCIPRAAANIFTEIGSMPLVDFSVRVSFLELYNEEVRDLLSKDEKPISLNIFNDTKGSVYMQGLQEVPVLNSNDIYALLQQGTSKRQTACTLMNSSSSRSHTVFTIVVNTREVNMSGEEVLKMGKINLVDLAGSENIAKSGCKDKRAQELANINRSLLTLGRVIQILGDKNTKHVPYRESKLTRILQDSLGGHTKSCIIATVSPCYSSYEETQSTLDYASRARNIKNTPMINEKVTKAQLIKEMNKEIEKLIKDLDAARSGEGFYVNRENWESLHSQVESNASAVALKNQIIEDMKKKVTELEIMRDTKIKEFDEIMISCKRQEREIEKCTSLLKEKARSLKEEKYLASQYANVATQNALQAKELLQTTERLSQNERILHKKLEANYLNSHSNEQVVKEKGSLLRQELQEAVAELNAIKKSLAESHSNHKMTIFKTQGKFQQGCEYIQSKLVEMGNFLNNIKSGIFYLTSVYKNFVFGQEPPNAELNDPSSYNHCNGFNNTTENYTEFMKKFEALSDDVKTYLAALEEDTNTLENEAENRLLNVVQRLSNAVDTTDDLCLSMVFTKSSGDTPKPNPIRFSKRIGETAPPRDALLKRFREEYVDSDAENDPPNFNDSPRVLDDCK